jgi:hypothetical protein
MRAVRRLQIAASLHVVAMHKHVPVISIEQAADVIRSLATAKTHTQDDLRLLAELEERTGSSITELSVLTKGWLPRG